MALGLFFSNLVGVGTSVLTGQGRPLLVTLLSFACVTPLTLGSGAVVIFVLRRGVVALNWCTAAAAAAESAGVFAICLLSPWRRLAREAAMRSERGPAQAAASAAAAGPRGDGGGGGEGSAEPGG